MGRAPCCDKANVKKGPWAPEEDAKLKAYIDEYGTGGNWIALPQKVGLKRCGKSCRLRWLNYLRPNLKHGDFTDEEDNTILSLYISIGSRWSIIAAQLPGRTDNDIKNYWNTKLKKKLLGRRKQPKMHEARDREDSASYTPTLSNSALERLQLHVQLQTLQNYDNSNLWPKLHPLQEKMIHNLQSSFGKATTNANPSFNYCPNPTKGKAKAEFHDQSKTGANNLQVPEEVDNSFNGSTLSDNSMMTTFHHGANLDHDNKVGAHELDCFKSTEVSKEVMPMMNSWISDDQFNVMQWSSSTTSLRTSSDVVFEDYLLGYY